jgi:PAS domain S-box-containing protein
VVQLKHLWARLVAPLVAGLNDERREQVRTVAGVSLAIWAISIIGFTLTLPMFLERGLPGALIVFGAISTFGIPYFLARLGKPGSATVFNSMLASVSIFMAAAVLDEDLNRNTLFYLITVCVYTTTFLSLRAAAVITTINLLLILLLGPGITGQSLAQVVSGPFTFNLIGTLFILLFVHYWRLREARKRDALAMNESRYRALSEHMSDYMFFARFMPDGTRIIQWETDQFMALTGYKADELGKDTLFQLVVPEDRLHILEGRKRIRQGEATEDQVRITRKDGVVRWIRVERIPVRDETSQNLVGYYGIVIDITEGKLAQEQELELSLRRAQFEVIDSFVKALSHDFRNRLSSIETTRYLISKEVSAESLTRIQPRLDQIQTNIQDMMIQISNLSMVNILNRPQMHPLDIAGLCEQLHSRYASRAASQGVTLTLKASDEDCIIMADSGQIERALEHLMNNALAHTCSGEIWLRVRKEKGQVCIEVEDTGDGIAEDKLSRIFQPFYRADDARTITVGGIGLGLTIVKLIVEAHHGSITVESQPKRGSLFRIHIPQHFNANHQ